MVSFDCQNCKHYQYYYHGFPNPNAYAKHYCLKCNDYIRVNEFGVWYPKLCYFNNYWEPSEEYLKEQEEKYTYYIGGLHCQIED